MKGRSSRSLRDAAFTAPGSGRVGALGVLLTDDSHVPFIAQGRVGHGVRAQLLQEGETAIVGSLGVAGEAGPMAAVRNRLLAQVGASVRTELRYAEAGASSVSPRYADGRAG